MKILSLLFLLPSLAFSAPVLLSWYDNSTNETAWDIQVAGDGEEFATFEGIASMTEKESGVRVEHTIDLPAGHTYSIRIRAANEVGYTGFTNVAIHSPAGPPNRDPSDAEASSQAAKVLEFEVFEDGSVKFNPITPAQ